MKNWKIPLVILGLLFLALIFRWGDLGSTTNNGTTIKTKVDYWNGSVWQTTIKNGSFTENMINSGRLEASRKQIDKQVKYQEPVYTEVEVPNRFTIGGVLKQKVINSYETKTKTIQTPPPPIYWLSSDGLFKIWLYITLIIGIWFIVTVVITGKKRNKTIEM